MNKLLLVMLISVYCNISNAATIKDATDASARGDHKAAFNILLPLAESGDVDALGNVGNKYAFGLGVKKDLKQAYHYWSLAADKHLATAMFNIAALHSSGQGGLTRDMNKAVIWFKKAAEHKHTRAMINLSSLYATGQILEKNIKLATAWAAIAANHERSKELKSIYHSQFTKLMFGLTKAETNEVQKIVDALEKNIKTNVNKYKNQ